MRFPEATNTERATRGAAAVTTFANAVELHQPRALQAYVASAMFAAERHAQTAGSTSPAQDIKNEICDEAFAKFADVVADVMHHLDGACQAHGLVSAAWHLYDVHSHGHDAEVIMISDAPDTGDAVDLLRYLCHAVDAFKGDPLAVLASGLSAFEEEAEAERVIQVRKARQDRLNG
ncbi:hypothetical protein ACIP98_29255 [Streptomyces sp. NPDC088354]|uniref:hypothetical protein n=1 Tax=Streptomyces sp. NPDC088354 TaxID=3365856 RepID=UPI0037F5737E